MWIDSTDEAFATVISGTATARRGRLTNLAVSELLR